MRKLLYTLGMALCFAYSPAQENLYKAPKTPTIEVANLKIPKDALSFIAMGDFGRAGGYFQKEVAHAMGEVGELFGVDFIVSVGDNFYPNGVQSTEDYHWQASYESIYTHPTLFEDWYVILGNHDYRGSVQAQLDYSKKSRRWHMPSPYYSKVWELEEGGKAQFLFIDTNVFIDDYVAEPEKYPELAQQDRDKQYRWIEEQLEIKDPTIKWRIVVGHHPLYSGGKRKNDPNTKLIEDKFRALFDANGVDAYICGHEHDLQIIQPKGAKTTQFLTGAGSEIRNSGSREGTLFAAAVPGFMVFSITDTELLVQTLQADGKNVKLLNTQKINKRK
ncbi:purple acid phosphatase family protein [Myroides guanonis]|uniref:acid phosphatase n=1 Tax=Myroides guanonis TaxID=1150112 RepID=A0A1I3SQ62_9FLAO|nr:tartrate-resistant acid phosphatase type 5 family protein [Myroides guanonis]SFJ60673.1 Calcineurin-like phosphoesterase [Myroides guanonis]